MRHSDSDIASSIVTLGLFLLLLALFLLVRASHTVITISARHPSHRGLLLASLCSALFLGLGLLTPYVLPLAAVSIGALWLIAKILEFQDEELMQRPWSLKGEVLSPATWWGAA